MLYEALWNIVCFLSLTLGIIANVRLSLDHRKHHDIPA